jgi:hypothetical protein
MKSSASCGGFFSRAAYELGLSFAILILAGCGGSSNGSNGNGNGSGNPPPPPQLAVWTNTNFGIPFTMVGTDPSIAGAGTTNIPAVIIPVSFNFSAVGVVMSPDSISCGDSDTALSRTQNSPLFNSAPWSDGAISLGNTQFGDAFQRANFWSLVSTGSPNYHVMLHPVSVLPTITVDVPVGIGAVLGPSPTCPIQPFGGVPISFMDTVVANTISSQHITADTVPIFLSYDMQYFPPSGGTFLGYHSIQKSQTYIVASYIDSGYAGLPGVLASDVAVLSHEVGEWMDDPLGNNVISPGWGGFGIQSNCSPQLEVGDPLTGSNFLVVTPSFTYHFQELAYFSWFGRNSPSLAVNGRYSMQGTFGTFAPPCP